MTRFDVRLDSFDARAPEPPVQALARLFGIHPDVAAGLLHSLPQIVKRNAPHDEASRVLEALQSIGGRGAIEPSRVAPPVSIPPPRVSGDSTADPLQRGPTLAFAPLDFTGGGNTARSQPPRGSLGSGSLELDGGMDDPGRRGPSTIPPHPSSAMQDHYVAGTYVPLASSRPPGRRRPLMHRPDAAAMVRIVALAAVLAVVCAIAFAVSR